MTFCYRKPAAFVLLFIIIILFSCAGTGYRGGINPGFAHFRIYVEQDGVPQEIRNNSVNLERRPFEIIIHLTGPDSIFVNASLDDDSYYAALDGMPFNDIPGFQESGMIEELFNRDETLMLSDTAPHYWHYSDRYDHRFSDVTMTDAYLICRKKISYVAEGEEQKNRVAVDKLRKDKIYLVFMKLEWTKDFTGRKEYKRTALKIDFS